jgi:PleD family two-component response regulator
MPYRLDPDEVEGLLAATAMPYRLDPDEVEGFILLGDDNETNRIVAEAMLKQAGDRFASVENGQMAVDAVTREDRPDLVLMDVQMPNMHDRRCV